MIGTILTLVIMGYYINSRLANGNNTFDLQGLR